jgi:signal transduction histidine kinase
MERLVVFRELAVTLCHEINNPLTTVNAYLHVLQRDNTEMSEPVREIIDNIKVETDRIASITAKLAEATSAATTRYNRDITMIDLNSCDGKL